MGGKLLPTCLVMWDFYLVTALRGQGGKAPPFKIRLTYVIKKPCHLPRVTRLEEGNVGAGPQESSFLAELSVLTERVTWTSWISPLFIKVSG